MLRSMRVSLIRNKATVLKYKIQPLPSTDDIVGKSKLAGKIPDLLGYDKIMNYIPIVQKKIPKEKMFPDLFVSISACFIITIVGDILAQKIHKKGKNIFNALVY